MRYLDSQFAVAMDLGKLTDVAYEVAVGLRCSKCEKKTKVCKCRKGE